MSHFSPSYYRGSIQGSVEQNYKLGPQIGKGNATWYKAIHKLNGEAYAIKEIKKQEDSRKALVRQIESLNAIEDTSKICRLFEVYEDSDNMWMVMEYCPNGDLFDKISDRAFFPEAEGKLIVRAILEAVYSCHKHNILHQNLKVDSFRCGATFNTDKLDIKLASFGRSVKLEDGQNSSDWISVNVSYKAPEHIQRNPFSFPSDMWAVGVISYIILGGYKPFEVRTDDTTPLRNQILSAKVVFHEEEWKEVSEVARDFIKKLLQVEPKDRLTAEDALKHPFINAVHGEIVTRKRRNTQKQLTFNATNSVRPRRPSMINSVVPEASIMSAHIRKMSSDVTSMSSTSPKESPQKDAKKIESVKSLPEIATINIVPPPETITSSSTLSKIPKLSLNELPTIPSKREVMKNPKIIENVSTELQEGIVELNNMLASINDQYISISNTIEQIKNDTTPILQQAWIYKNLYVNN